MRRIERTVTRKSFIIIVTKLQEKDQEKKNVEVRRET